MEGRRFALLTWLMVALASVGMSSTAWAQAAETELVFAGWGGTMGDAFKSTVLPPFEKQNHVRILYLTQETVDMLARLKAQAARPQIDVVAGTDASHANGVKAGLFDQLDSASYAVFKDLYPFARPEDGIGVMFGIQSLGLEYNTKVFAEKHWPAPSSWYDLWDPKYKGHVVIYNLPAGYATTFLGVLAVLEGGSPANLDPAFAKLPGLVPNAMAFVGPSAQLDMLFSTSGAWLAYNGSGRVAALAATGVPVAFALPKEGGVLNPNWLDLVKGAPHPKISKLFIEYMLSPQAQALIAKAVLLGPVNKTVTLRGATAAAVPYGPDAVGKLKQIDNQPINDQLGSLVHRWDAMIAKR